MEVTPYMSSYTMSREVSPDSMKGQVIVNDAIATFLVYMKGANPSKRSQ